MKIYVKRKWYNEFYRVTLSEIKKSRRGNEYREVLAYEKISKYEYYKHPKNNRVIVPLTTYKIREKLRC